MSPSLLTKLTPLLDGITRIRVQVTFLRMDQYTGEREKELPLGYQLIRLSPSEFSFYRYLYNTVGRDYCWWMKRALSDQALVYLLSNPAIEVYVLKDSQGVVLGFFELDQYSKKEINLANFGLMPYAIGHGIGFAFLCQAVKFAWMNGPQLVRVNTCNLDHPRALGLYKRVGFCITHTQIENWDIPNRFNLPIPEAFLTGKSL